MIRQFGADLDMPDAFFFGLIGGRDFRPIEAAIVANSEGAAAGGIDRLGIAGCEKELRGGLRVPIAEECVHALP